MLIAVAAAMLPLIISMIYASCRRVFFALLIISLSIFSFSPLSPFAR